MNIKTSDTNIIEKFAQQLFIPEANSHKGNNGKVLIIGGSHLFHSASLWAAEIASFFVDMVHYSSTRENNEIFQELKKVFRNGIVVEKKDIHAYVTEDDAILIGPGMVRSDINKDATASTYEEIISIDDESIYTRELTRYLIETFPEKRFVFDAGALQMMDVEWLKRLKQKPIITPHQLEFERLFGIHIQDETIEKKKEIVKQKAFEYNCVILLKAVVDIVSDGTDVYVIEGGNPGLTKGGSGDILAGLTVTLYSKNSSIVSAIMASYLVKKAADELAKTVGYSYNIEKLIQKIPETYASLTNTKQ